MTRFIAEISSNHNGDLGRCREMIAAAAAAGCWGVKFQLFRIESLFACEILRASPEHRARRRWELPPWFLPELAACARDHGVVLGCTPFDLDAVELLAPHVGFLKVASYELPWLDLTAACAKTGLPLMLSTGMADRREIAAAVAAAFSAGCLHLTVFHCVSAYPAAPESCNLAAIASLRDLARPLVPVGTLRTGWSDHSVHPGVVRRAVERWGADTIEFHFDLEGGGEEFAGGHCWLPGTIAPVIAGQAAAEAPDCDGDGRLGPVPAEAAERAWRADPSDGLRPNLAVRRTWPAQRRASEPAGPLFAFLPQAHGWGHLMRCLALAEALRDGHRARPLFLVPEDPAIQAVLDRHGLPWITHAHGDGPLLPAAGGSLPTDADAWIVDVLDPAPAVAEFLAHAGRPVVLVDRPEVAGAALGLVPSLSWSPPADRPDLTGGPGHLLVRQDVVRLRPPGPLVPDGPVLVSFGGADPNRLTEKVLAALADRLPDAPVRVVIGPAFADRRGRLDRIRTIHPRAEAITAGAGLERLIAAAGLVVTALGVTVAEAMCLGRPVALLTNWEKDRPLAAALAAADLVADLGPGSSAAEGGLAEELANLWADIPRRTRSGAGGWGHCDGRGAERAADLVAALCGQGGGRPC